ncbi:MAG TPA: glycosyltransferase [Bacteroidota bacterium]|nr:glycosyltransferase [Bacteroidota bacterium]
MIVTLLYLLQAAFFLWGVHRGCDHKISSTPFVSVIVAARNEEMNLPRCLESLATQTYDLSLHEIIIVNDQSTDATEKIITDFAHLHPQFRLVNAQFDARVHGKGNALAQGVDVAQGEIILITDADCIVPPTWIEATAQRYSGDVGLVGGFTLQTATSPFEGMQSLDWAYILGMAAAGAALFRPLGSIGNNLSFRKTAYEEVGGYRKLKFSVTEDYTIVQAIVQSKRWKYRYPIDENNLVVSMPCQDWQTLIRQKHRWGKGGLDMKPEGFCIMAISFLMQTAPFVMLYWGGVVQAATALMLKFIADYIFLYQVLKRLNRTKELTWFYWFELYYLGEVIVLPFLVFFGGKIHWKGRTF